MPKRNVYVDRLGGYKKALAEHGIAFREDYVIINTLSLEAGIEAAEMMIQMNPMPDGIFVANDNCAVGCMIRLKQTGIRIPEDVAIVGFNNDPVSKVVEPNLSTINYPGYEMGDVAARHLINHLNGTTQIQSTNLIILRSDLIVRASSQRIND